MYRLILLLAFGASVAWMYASPGYEPFIGILTSIGGLLRDELHGIVGANLLSLTPRRPVVKELSNARYSFIRPDYICPLVLADLNGWLSDSGDQIVAVDLIGSNQSNRYHVDEIIVESDPAHPVITAKRGRSSFSYKYLGRSFSGIHLVQTSDWEGGSGMFCNIMLVTLSIEPAVSVGPTGASRHDRFVIKKVASIPLGDRYSGNISYRAGILTIGACSGLATLRKSRQRLLVL